MGSLPTQRSVKTGRGIHHKILWTKNCGLGWSSFAVTESSLFGQEQLSTGDCVTARDLNTGELLWTTAEDTDGFTSGLGGDGPRATPTLHLIEGDESSRLVLFAVGPTGLLRCLDASTGEVVWKQYLMEEFPGERTDPRCLRVTPDNWRHSRCRTNSRRWPQPGSVRLNGWNTHLEMCI